MWSITVWPAFYLRGVSHVLKVRIIADMKNRIQEVMDREKISYESAQG